MKTSLLDRHGQILLLALLLATALSLRLFGQDWDQGTYQHPDERFIAMVSANRLSMPAIGDLGEIFSPATSPLNPRRDDENGNPLSFAYGSLPMYVQGVTGSILNLFSERDWNSYGELYKVGRTLTAIVDTLTVAFIFLLGRRLFGPAAGFIGAALYTFTVLAIQLAHFFTVDTWLTLFVTATLYFAIRFMDSPTIWRSLAVGATVGMAFATKASVPSLLAPILLAYAWAFWKSNRKLEVASFAAAGGLLSLAVFSLFEPYALVRSGPFIEDIRNQARIVRGETDIPFTRQFVGLIPGIYELRNMFAFTMGPGLFTAAFAGIGVGLWRAITLRDVRLAIPLLWIVAYLPTTLTTEARFLRYSLPIMPVMAIFAAGLLVWLVSQQRLRVLGQIATAATLIVTLIWAAGFTTIYMQEHPRIQASRWIHENIPAGATLSAEAWDDPLPVRYPGAPANTYDIETLDIYGDQPPEQKVEYLYETLEDVEYIVLSSNRLVDSVDNLPWRYPVQNEFYRRLEAGQLGYRLVYEEQVKPELFGVSLDDRSADESFTVYDHPHVRIYQRVERLSASEFRERFLWAINQPWEPTRYPAVQRLLLDGPVAEAATTSGEDWNTPATDNGIAAALSWILAIEIIGLSVLPMAARALSKSPDRGALSARLIGIIVIGWIIWFGASLDLWPATVWTVLLVTAGIAAASWLPWLWSRSASPAWRLPSLTNYLSGLALFIAGFAILLLFRAVYPDFWQTYYGGEKPFELAYLRAVASSAEFPPYDPWYAGGVINYYYYGWHLVASIVKLSGVGVSMGFQLGIATVGSLLVLQCVSLTGLLARPRRNWIVPGVPLAGAAVAFFLVVAGNLDGIRQIWEFRAHVADQFDFWRSTRVIDYTINEFPYFSMIWADLHPHVMNLPHYLLLLTLLAAYIREARSRSIGAQRMTGNPIMLIGLTAVTLGTISITNSWDAPLAIGLTMGAFLYAGALRGGLQLFTSTAYGLFAVAVSFLIFSVFYLNFYSVVDGVEVASSGSSTGQFLTHWGLFMIILLGVLSMGVLRRRRLLDRLNGMFLMLSVFLGAAGLSALVQSLRGEPPAPGEFIVAIVIGATLIAGIAPLDVFRINRWLIVVAVMLAGLLGGLAGVRPAAAIVGALAVVAILHALARWKQPARFVPWALIAAAAVTIAAVEIIYVADDLRNSPWERMNTVFKFYMQAWILLAAGSVLLLAQLLHRPGVQDWRRTASSMVGIGTLAIALCLGLIYPVFGTPARLSQEMPGSPSGFTLDGYAWMDGSWIHNATGEEIRFDGDRLAIEWLNENVDGTPVILEASIGPYRGNGSRISSATGLPTVLGWDRHQRQQRYEPGINERMEDVRAIYNEEDPAVKLDMLRSYRVRYVIVGDVERLWNTPEDPQVYASEAGLEAFQELVGNGLTVAFVAGDTIIYEVEEFPKLPSAASS